MTLRYLYEQPSLDFEKGHHLSGIAGRYTFPSLPGMDRAALQARIWDRKKGLQCLPEQELRSIFAQVESLNPDHVARIAFDRADPKQMESVLHGMISGFNTDDINLYMQRSHGSLPQNDPYWVEADAQRKATEIKIMQRLKPRPNMQWVASDTTLDRIFEQVKDRPIINSFEEASRAVNGGPSSNPVKWLVAIGLIAAGGTAWYVMNRRHEEKVTERTKQLSKSDGDSKESWVESHTEKTGRQL